MGKILITEDNQDIRDNLEEFLELSNYHVITAENGKKGITCIQENKPDLILCDISMPEINGNKVLEHIKAEPSFTKTPFVFITSSSQQEDIENGKHAGADAYLTKPFPTHKLVETIEKLFKEKMIYQ